MRCIGGAIKVCVEDGGSTVYNKPANRNINNKVPSNNGNSNSIFFRPTPGNGNNQTQPVNGTNNNGNPERGNTVVGNPNQGGVIINLPIVVQPQPIYVIQPVLPGYGWNPEPIKILPVIPKPVENPVNNISLTVKRGIKVLNSLERKIEHWLNQLEKATERGNPLKVVRHIYRKLIRKGISVNPYQDIVKPNLTVNANKQITNFNEWVNFNKQAKEFSMAIDAQAKNERVHEWVHMNPQQFQYAGEVEKPNFRVHEYINVNKTNNQKQAYIEIETPKFRFAENIQITAQGFQWSVNYTNKAVA